MELKEFGNFVEKHRINNFGDIATTLNILADYIGGEHLNKDQAAIALRIYSRDVDKLTMETLIKLSCTTDDAFGIGANDVRRYLENKEREEIKNGR